MMFKYQRLSEADYPAIFRTMDEAFSDYQVAMKMDIQEYRTRLALEGVSFENSVGVFDREKLVGSTMNGVGYRNGEVTVHDTGTAVLPEYRRRGASTGMFDFIIPHLRDNGFKVYTLEVIVNNIPALSLYQKLGFDIEREFAIYENPSGIESKPTAKEIEIKEMASPDWDSLREFWNFEPAWQNSVDCIDRAKTAGVQSVVLGIYKHGQCIGYGAIFPDSGKIAQIAISDSERRNGYATMLLAKLQTFTKEPLLMTNIDVKAEGVAMLLESVGFNKKLSQFEMLLKL